MKRRTIKRIAGTQIVELRYAGEVTYRAGLETLDELQALWPATSSNRLLVNCTSAWPSRSPFAMRGHAAFVERLSRIRCEARIRVALLNPIAAVWRTGRLAKRANITLGSFHDREIAIAWLRSPRP